MAARKLPPAEHLEFLISRNYSTKELAKMYGVLEESVRNKLFKAGIKAKGKPDKETLDLLYNIQEKSIASIATEFDRSPETIKKWLRSYKIKVRANKFASKETEKHRYKPLTEYVSKEDLKIAEGRRKKDIVCNYKVGDPIEIYGEVRTVIQVTRELVVTKGVRVESFHHADV